MGDPLSIAASVVALAGATSAAIKGGATFYKIARRAGVISGDAKLFASQIKIFGFVVSGARDKIRDHYMNYTDSATLKRLEEQNILQELVFQVDHLMQRVKYLRPRERSHGKGLGLKARFRWVLERDDREELRINMGIVERRFGLLMQEITYEALGYRAYNQDALPPGLFDFQREMKEHRDLMRTQMNAMRLLKEQLETQRSRRIGPTQQQYGIGGDVIDEVLMGLAEKLIRDERSTVSSSVVEDQSSVFSDFHSQDQAGTVSTNLKLAPLRNSASYPSKPPSKISPKYFVTTSSSQRIQKSDGTSESSESGVEQKDPSESLSGSGTWEVVGIGDRSSIYADDGDGDYMAVEPSDKVLRLGPDLEIEAIHGHINKRLEPYVAKVCQGFSQNVISQVLATQLSLEFEDHEDVDGVTHVDFGNIHLEPVRGRVTFNWINGLNSHLRPLKVTCLVCDHTPHPLILGQTFYGRRQHYWRSASLRDSR